MIGSMPKNMPIEQRFFQKVDKTNGECWIWTGARMGKGYGKIKFGNRIIGAHRLSYLLHKGIIPEKIDVCHKCDNPICVNPTHLFLGTRKDNVQDMIGKNREGWGEKSGHNILTLDQVIGIRKEYSSGKFTQRFIAKKYKVDYRIINDIVKRKTWKKA